MGYVKWSYDTLNTFCHDVFRKFGFNEEETNIIKDVLLTADLYGIESHGMQRMVRYDKGIEKGTIHPDAKPEVVFETPVSAVIDGHDGMGQLISHFAMEKAIEKAKKTGVGFVSVRNSNHFGIAGYYAEMASKQGLLGMACTNSENWKCIIRWENHFHRAGLWEQMVRKAQMPRMYLPILLPRRAAESCRLVVIKR